jgi:threonyl-tRNA synthetase
MDEYPFLIGKEGIIIFPITSIKTDYKLSREKISSGIPKLDTMLDGKGFFRGSYKEIKTPVILARSLWEESGHWDHYKENMYFTKIDDRDFAIKPMNCPGAILIYKNTLHSYKEFPLRTAELGLVHRHELAGVLHGLMRVRAFHQDDAHIFCLPEQIEKEISNIIDLIDKMYGRLGLKYHLELSTRPEKGSIGSDEMWQKAENSLKKALDKKGIEYKLNPGDGAFYGPKIDFHIEDAIGRTWQTGTIQLDFAMPERFDLEYIAEDGSKQRPVMLHRVVFGSVERFIGILLEHFAGSFPIWLAPTQVVTLPIADRHADYANKVANELRSQGIRVEIDDRSETIGKKIREGELQKIPYMLIIGDKEIEAKKVSVRKYGEGDRGQFELKDLIKEINA